MTKFSGMPHKAYNMQKIFPIFVDGVECPYPTVNVENSRPDHQDDYHHDPLNELQYEMSQKDDRIQQLNKVGYVSITYCSLQDALSSAYFANVPQVAETGHSRRNKVIYDKQLIYSFQSQILLVNKIQQIENLKIHLRDKIRYP
uniref:Uncharacterized protein n=1 Tax=Romanomermis culicivorax TaxID=13658 RepID=A0A915HMZ8_ROMCU